jgi:hypothetical protein
MTTELPAPPLPAECDLRRYRKMPIDIVRLQSSDIQMECSPEEKWFAFELWMAAFHQVPAASLPDHDEKLAYMAGLSRDKRTWNRVKKAALRGFVKHSDGRLYHPVLADICREVWETMRARKRGANETNSRRPKKEPIDKSRNVKRSAARSIYSERDGERTASETLEQRSAVATEGVGITHPLTPASASAVSGLDGPAVRPTETREQRETREAEAERQRMEANGSRFRIDPLGFVVLVEASGAVNSIHETPDDEIEPDAAAEPTTWPLAPAGVHLGQRLAKPEQTPRPRPVLANDTERWCLAIDDLVSRGEWDAGLGPKPGEIGCRADRTALALRSQSLSRWKAIQISKITPAADPGARAHA